LFRALNRKGDGKLTLNECLNALFQDFAAIDVDQNGSITVQEIEAYIWDRIDFARAQVLEGHQPEDAYVFAPMEGFSETLIKNHFTLYQGYVTNTNKAMEIMAQMLKEGKTATPEFAEIRRRFGWEFNGMRLHELYFENHPDQPLKDEWTGLPGPWMREFAERGRAGVLQHKNTLLYTYSGRNRGPDDVRPVASNSIACRQACFSFAGNRVWRASMSTASRSRASSCLHKTRKTCQVVSASPRARWAWGVSIPRRAATTGRLFDEKLK
jgi:hypothetical protein